MTSIYATRSWKKGEFAMPNPEVGGNGRRITTCGIIVDVDYHKNRINDNTCILRIQDIDGNHDSMSSVYMMPYTPEQSFEAREAKIGGHASLSKHGTLYKYPHGKTRPDVAYEIAHVSGELVSLRVGKYVNETLHVGHLRILNEEDLTTMKVFIPDKPGDTTREPAWECVGCGKKLDCCTNYDNKAAVPEDGSITICIECGKPYERREGKWEPMTTDEINALPNEAKQTICKYQVATHIATGKPVIAIVITDKPKNDPWVPKPKRMRNGCHVNIVEGARHKYPFMNPKRKYAVKNVGENTASVWVHNGELVDIPIEDLYVK